MESNRPDFVIVRYKKCHKNAFMPTYAHDGDAGADLAAPYDFTIEIYEPCKVALGIAVEIPSGYFGLISDRSSMAKKGVVVSGGVIDSGYRGEISVLLRNTTDTTQKFKRGDRVAQLLILPCPQVRYEGVDELTSTTRGHGGFGSSGA